MHVHLEGYEVSALRRQAQLSVEIGDDGELFAEEAAACLGEDEVAAIEGETGAMAEDFMLEVFANWEGNEPEMILEALAVRLEELDIELTYDEPEEDELQAVSEWEDDVEIDDDFEGY